MEEVNVRVAPADLALMRKAAEKLWPGMPITNSTLVLMLAKAKAQEVLEQRKK